MTYVNERGFEGEVDGWWGNSQALVERWWEIADELTEKEARTKFSESYRNYVAPFLIHDGNGHASILRSSPKDRRLAGQLWHFVWMGTYILEVEEVDDVQVGD